MKIQKEITLTDYLLKCNFSVKDTLELQKMIAGMTADQIIGAMESAKKIQDQLNSTSLGKELS